MLTYEQKLAIIESFPELERKDVSLGRMNFHYEGSVHDKKNVVYHLHPNGNGYVYAGQLPGVATDDKGFVNIRDYTEERLRALLRDSIRSLSANSAAGKEAAAPAEAAEAERWQGPDNQTLTVTYEDELWYVYAGRSLESAFETYEEVEQYMLEEGFTRK